MREWGMRSTEVKYLLNPAFCGRVLYAAIAEYESKGSHIPFPLLYLILPLVLHKTTREKINSKSKMLNWVHKNQDVLVGFATRAKGLLEITNESIEFLLCSGIVQITNVGEFIITQKVKPREKDYPDKEIKECIEKARHVARWFINTGTTENIYVNLGVRP